MRTKHEIVLRALQSGQSVELPNGLKYVMDDDETCIEVKMWKDAKKVNEDPDEIGLMTSNISLNEFMRLCDSVPDNEIAIIAANTALNRCKFTR